MKNGKRHVYAMVSETEYATVHARAVARGLSMSNYIRECVNGAALEEGADAPLLETSRVSPRRTPLPAVPVDHGERFQDD